MFNFFQNKSVSAIIKKLSKAVCVFTAVFSLAVFSGCDLISSIIGGGEDENPDVVTISPLNATITVGNTITLTATSSEGRAISWTSSDDEVAEVDGGEVTGKAEGTASVTASDGKKMATCEITVLPAEKEPDGENDNKGEQQKPQAKITISASTITIFEGASYNLLATASDGSVIEWSSSNKNVATVENGNVTGVKEGTVTITASSATAQAANCTVTVLAQEMPDEPEFKLVWSDEFNGTSLDSTKWGYQTGVQDYYGNSTGPVYWGNDELQYYTDGANVKVSDGALQITAKKESMPNGRGYSSARIATRDKFSQTYGYFEARIKSPAIEGMWPAFWMLPQPSDKTSSDNIYGGWPNNGEIDIMEAKGRLKNVVDCTLHFGRGWQNENHMMSGKSPRLSSNVDEWHTYAVDWRKDYIAWIVDGTEVHRVTSSQWWTGSSNKETAPFDQPFYMLINLAVGGQYDGYRTPPDDFTQASMYIDYVRVYQLV